jgi:hypothetical protein
MVLDYSTGRPLLSYRGELSPGDARVNRSEKRVKELRKAHSFLDSDLHNPG